MQAWLATLVTGLRIESQWLPPIVIRDPFSTSASPGAGSEAGALLKPRVSIEIAGDPRAVSVAPWGDPGESRWPEVKILLVAVGVVAAALIVSRVMRK